MQWRSAWVWRAIAPLFAATIVASCSQDDLGTGPRISSIVIVSGNKQTAAIGGLLPQPLVVRIIDQHGDPLADQLVTWEVTKCRDFGGWGARM